MPIYALMRTKAYLKGNLALVHEWSCDTNRNAKAFILENHKPKVFYDDILRRKHAELAPVGI